MSGRFLGSTPQANTSTDAPTVSTVRRIPHEIPVAISDHIAGFLKNKRSHGMYEGERGLGFYVYQQEGQFYDFAAFTSDWRKGDREQNFIVDLFRMDLGRGVKFQSQGWTSVSQSELQAFVVAGSVPCEVPIALMDQLKQSKAYFREIDLIRKGRSLQGPVIPQTCGNHAS